jgi:hypothetical protein
LDSEAYLSKKKEYKLEDVGCRGELKQGDVLVSFMSIDTS